MEAVALPAITSDNGVMADVDTLPCDVLPCRGGDVILVPYVLPIRVPAAALTLTVAEWLGVTPPPQLAHHPELG